MCSVAGHRCPAVFHRFFGGEADPIGNEQSRTAVRLATTGSECADNFGGTDLPSMGVTFDIGRQLFLISTTRNVNRNL
jgi:hypothetical protein